MRIIIVGGLILLCAGFTAAQSGGNFSLTGSVIAGGGGGPSIGGPFLLTGTVGQPVSGQDAAAGQFTVSAGFWTTAPQLTTAATAGVSGRVVDSAGSPLRNAVITMRNSSGVVIVTRTNGFGYFAFDDVQTGDSYLVTIDARLHNFAPQVVAVRDSIAGLEFRAID